MSFLDDYEPVAARLEKFWAEHPLGRVSTMLVGTDPVIVFRADLYRDENDERPYATGWAHQRVLTAPPTGRNNKPNESAPEWTSPYEVCETSAVGRALANANYATKERRPSREEIHQAQAPVATITDEQVTTLGNLLGTLQRYPDAWKARQLPAKSELATLPAHLFDTALKVLNDEIAASGSSNQQGEHPTEASAGEGGNSSPSSPELLPSNGEVDLAGQPCERCGSTRAKRVLGAGGHVLCRNTADCDVRVSEKPRV